MINPNTEEVRLKIETATVIKVVLILVAFALLYVLRDLAIVILTAVVIASAVEPAARWFGRYRVPRVPAVLIVYIVAFAILVALIPFFILPVLGDLVEISGTLPARLRELPFSLADYLPLQTLSENNLFQELSAGVTGLLSSLSSGLLEVLSVIFGGFFDFILIVVLSFYLAVQKNGVENFLRIVIPRQKEEYIVGLWRRTQIKIGYWIQGQLILALIIGVIVYLGLTILGVDYALMLAIIAALLELIPIFGPIIAAVPAVLLAFSEGIGLGFMTIGFYIIIQQFENHLIYPLVVNRVVGVPPLVVIVALVVGYQLAGFLGVLLAVPVSTMLIEILHDIEHKKRGGAVVG